MLLVRLILGRRLANREHNERKIGAFEGVPAMGLDGLGSSSYGPEAALTILIPLGAAGLAYIGTVMLPILALLAILYVSYRQTIRAYPTNGGAYTVSKENLRVNASLLAAAALMVDYILNVAVGISAGVGALTSAVPTHFIPTHPNSVSASWRSSTSSTCAARSTPAACSHCRRTSSSRAFSCCWRSDLPNDYGGRPPAAGESGAGAARRDGGRQRRLLLRSFAAGCTAMTGVEAVSNGVGAFREPVVKYGHRTLGAICANLGILLAGIAYLTHAYGIGAMDQTQAGYQSAFSQLAGAVVGRGVFYYVAIGSVLCVLCLSANTSFVDFPRLCRLAAQDDFLPRPFAVVGRRLVYSVDILYLATIADLLP